MLALDLIELVTPVPLGSTVDVPYANEADPEFIRRWADGTGNAVLAVHPDVVVIHRGRVDDPIAAMEPTSRPGYRLWMYTNFHCNLVCDYCCVESSPTAARRILDIDTADRLLSEAIDAGAHELFITGGEPFLVSDMDERLHRATRRAPVTVLTNAMLWRGKRLDLLKRCPRDRVTLQVSIDSSTAPRHDHHRGIGSFDRAMDGIATALELGFQVRVAATLEAGDTVEEAGLNELFDRLGLDPAAQVVRRIAKQGTAESGLMLSRTSLIPEVTVTATGVFWHPVTATNDDFKVTASLDRLDATIENIRDEFRGYRRSGDLLAASFPCG